MQLYLGAEIVPSETPDFAILQVAALAMEDRRGEAASYQGTCEWMSDLVSCESREKTRKRNNFMVAGIASSLRTFLEVHASATLHSWRSDITKAFFSAKPWSIGQRYWGECVSFSAGLAMKGTPGLRDHADRKTIQYPDLDQAARFFGISLQGRPEGGILHDLRTMAAIHAKLLEEREAVEAEEEISYALEHGIY